MRTLATLFALLLAAAVVSADSFDRWVPDTTIAYVSLPNVSRTRDRFMKSPLHGLWTDAAVQEFMKGPLQKLQGKLQSTKADLGFSPFDMWNLLQGEVALAWVGVEGKEPKPQFILLADFGDQLAKFTELWKKLEDNPKALGSYRREEEEFRGAKIVTYHPQKEGEDAFVMFCTGTVVGFSNAGLDKVHETLVRPTSEDLKSLADNTEYQRVRARTGKDSDLLFYADVGTGVHAFLDKEDAATQKDVMKYLVPLGVMDLGALCFQGTLLPDGYVNQAYITMSKKRGILKLFDGKNSAGLAPPSFVPAEAYGIYSVNLDLSEILKEAGRTAEAIRPGASAFVGMIEGQLMASTGVSLTKDILPALGQTYTLYMLPPSGADESHLAPGERPTTAVPAGAAHESRVVVAADVSNHDLMQATIDKIVEKFGPNLIEDQEYLGTKLHVLKTPGGGVQPAFALFPNHFVFASRLEDLQAVARRYGKDVKGLVDEASFAKLAAGLPAQRSGISYSDQARAFEVSVDNLKNLPFYDQVDWSKFPSFEVLSKYLGPGISVLVNEDKGIYTIGRSQLKAPKQEQPAPGK